MSPVICKSIIIFEICVFYSINLVNVLHNLLKTVHTPYKELDGEQLSVTYAPLSAMRHNLLLYACDKDDKCGAQQTEKTLSSSSVKTSSKNSS